MKPETLQKTFFVVMLLLMMLGLYYFSGLLAPLLLGTIMAYVLHPLQDKMVHKGVPASIASAILVLATMLSVVVLVLMVVEVILHSIPLIKAQLPAIFEQVSQVLKRVAGRIGVDPQMDPEQLRALITSKVSGEFDSIAGGVINTLKFSGGAVLQTLAISILFPLALFYLLVDWKRDMWLMRNVIPSDWQDQVFNFFESVDQTLSGFLRGQMLVMLILMVYYSTALFLIGLKLSLPLGIFSGAAYVIPYIGFGISLILAVLEAGLQLQTWLGIALVIGVYACGQFLESFFLTPKLIGSRIGLSPITVIFSLLVFGQLFGFWGVLLALPLAAVLAVLMRHLYQLIYVILPTKVVAPVAELTQPEEALKVQNQNEPSAPTHAQTTKDSVQDLQITEKTDR